MKRHLRDRIAAVRLPRRLQEASARLPATREQLTASLSREPSPAELAAVLEISPDDLARIQSAASEALDETTAGNGEEELEASDHRILLAGAFQSLDETDRRIVYLRFVKELSRRQTAAELGISEAALARRTDTALARLRNELEGRAFEPAAPAQTAKPAEEPRKKESRHSGRLLLRMPQSLHEELAASAEREDVSLNQYITNALASTVGWNREGGAAPEPREPAPRWLPAALVTNIVVVLIAGAVALVLLVVALQRGL
jgi:RNA polymerase sigma factor (sigma-70 family)